MSVDRTNSIEWDGNELHFKPSRKRATCAARGSPLRVRRDRKDSKLRDPFNRLLGSQTMARFAGSTSVYPLLRGRIWSRVGLLSAVIDSPQ
jgi:hypothetical protein